jgi:hypothetical protein
MTMAGVDVEEQEENGEREPRGKVGFWNTRMAQRCRESLARVNWKCVFKESEQVTLITTTVPEAYGQRPNAFRVQMKEVHRRMMVLYLGSGGYWRIEPQPKNTGNPHDHSILMRRRWDVDVYRGVYKDVFGWKEGDAEPQIQFDVVESVEQIEYLCGYAVKPAARPGEATGEPVFDGVGGEGEGSEGGASSRLEKAVISEHDGDGWEFPGRQWGVFGAENIPWAEKQVVEVMPGRWQWEVRRAVRNLKRAERRRGRKEAEARRVAAGKLRGRGVARARRKRQREDPGAVEAVNRGGFRAVGYTGEVARLVEYYTGREFTQAAAVTVRDSVLEASEWMRLELARGGGQKRRSSRTPEEWDAWALMKQGVPRWLAEEAAGVRAFGSSPERSALPVRQEVTAPA